MNSNTRGFCWQLLIGILIVFTSNDLNAQWPTDPKSPLVFGEVEVAPVDVEHATARTPDGALWVTWLDSYCLGEVRVQRIAPDGSLLEAGGLFVEQDLNCGVSAAPIIAACPDNSVVIRRRNAELGTALHRISATGEFMWGQFGISITDLNIFGEVGGIVGLPNGDVLVGWYQGSSTFMQRFDESGEPVWPQDAVFDDNGTSNRRIFEVVPDGQNGAYVFWESPVTYEEMVQAMRFTGDGQPAWQEVLVVVPADIGSSRHSDPAAISDGNGGAIVVWSRGEEIQTHPGELYLQQINSDATTTFAESGLRVSNNLTRQFDPELELDEKTGDIFVVWREDFFEAQHVRAQRLSLTGEKLWGGTGVFVAPLNDSLDPAPLDAGNFAASWTGNMLAVAVGSQETDEIPSVFLHRVNVNGEVNTRRTQISNNVAAGDIDVRNGSRGSVVVTWHWKTANFNDQMSAQRVNQNGILGTSGPYFLHAR